VPHQTNAGTLTGAGLGLPLLGRAPDERIADRPLTRRLHTKLAGQYRWAYGINAGANDKAEERADGLREARHRAAS
jgi:hypothetical protein